MARTITLGTTPVADTTAPYMIAEIGVNHEGSLERAEQLIRLAKEGGAHAAKFQSYKAETLASRHSPAYWDLNEEPTTSQFELFQKYDTFDAKDYQHLAAYCRKIGIDFLSTPFDDEAVAFLAPLVPFFKIASADITTLPFLEKVAAHGKPVVLSTGASTPDEIAEAVRVLLTSGASEVALLHCVLSYPTRDEDAHLGMIQGLCRHYPDLVIGYSDHTVPSEDMRTLTTAYLLGARVIEKHFTDDKTLPGNDHYHAMDVHDLQRFQMQIEHIRMLVGPMTEKQPVAAEEAARAQARRSIVLKKDVQAGEVLQEAMLTYKRPGTGISPVQWHEVLGRKAQHDLAADHVLQWEDIATDQTYSELR